MSDGVVMEGIRELGAHGPAWIIALFLLVAAVVLGLALIPTLKSWIEAKSAREEVAQQMAKEREERKREEMKQRAEKDGQMISLVAENNRVIERNSSAFRQVIQSVEDLSDKTARLDSTMHKVLESKEKLEDSISEMRIDIAGLKKGH